MIEIAIPVASGTIGLVLAIRHFTKNNDNTKNSDNALILKFMDNNLELLRMRNENGLTEEDRREEAKEKRAFFAKLLQNKGYHEISVGDRPPLIKYK